MSAESSEQLAKDIAQFLHLIRWTTDLKTIDVFVELDLTITQIRVIFLLAGTDHALLISEVAEQLDLSAATAGRSVDRLATLGLVARGEDPDDRRSRRVALTPTGQDLADTQRQAVWDRIREFSQALPAEMATSLHDALRAALDSTPDHLRADPSCISEPSRSHHER